jgi:hypothetical protein
LAQCNGLAVKPLLSLGNEISFPLKTIHLPRAQRKRDSRQRRHEPSSANNALVGATTAATATSQPFQLSCQHFCFLYAVAHQEEPVDTSFRKKAKSEKAKGKKKAKKKRGKFAKTSQC